VEGLPLGLLLASAWVDAITISEIGDEIERSLDFLASDWVDAPERQLSLRATFDYSWSMLGQREQLILRAISVFRGSFTKDAAEQTCSASLRDLHGLVDRSLLQASPEGRYWLHDLLRQYLCQRQLDFPISDN
jgi:predicted ATPase